MIVRLEKILQGEHSTHWSKPTILFADCIHCTCADVVIISPVLFSDFKKDKSKKKKKSEEGDGDSDSSDSEGVLSDGKS